VWRRRGLEDEEDCQRNTLMLGARMRLLFKRGSPQTSDHDAWWWWMGDGQRTTNSGRVADFTNYHGERRLGRKRYSSCVKFSSRRF
jgi:hypothetical protein